MRGLSSLARSRLVYRHNKVTWEWKLDQKGWRGRVISCSLWRGFDGITGVHREHCFTDTKGKGSTLMLPLNLVLFMLSNLTIIRMFERERGRGNIGDPNSPTERGQFSLIEPKAMRKPAQNHAD